jgi:nucleoside-diphosphate-sugar epimerase
MAEERIIVLGADGFVGRNLLLKLETEYECSGSSRRSFDFSLENLFYFDIENTESWQSVVGLNPTIIVNCIGYGVVKHQQEISAMLKINYLSTIDLFRFLATELPESHLIHLGTAFEYDVNGVSLQEDSVCAPISYYGISKFLASNFLLQSGYKNFTIVRPFNMFGPFETSSKLIPSLILSQKSNVPIRLTSGNQERDFVFIDDLARLVLLIIRSKKKKIPKLINLGTSRPLKVKVLANLMIPFFGAFNPELWQWGEIPNRVDEPLIFYNDSNLAKMFGLNFDSLQVGLEITINHYFNVQ